MPPWTIVEATDRRYATVKIYTVITQMLTAGIDNRRREIARENGGRGDPGSGKRGV